MSSSTTGSVPGQPDDGRGETENQRLDRNWNEILQELRVTQTGTQILTGFLLTIAFQPTFKELNQTQLVGYLILVSAAVLSTALGLAPVNLHRSLFRKRAKGEVVQAGHVILRIMVIGVGTILTGTIWLIFDVAVGHLAGVVAGLVTLAAVVVIGLVPKLTRSTK